MALIHPHSLERWQEWRDTRRPAAALRGAASRLLRRPDPAQAAAPGFTLHTREGTGTSRVLLGIDAAGPTGQESLLAVLPYLHGTVEVLTPADLDLSLPGDADWTHHPVIEPRAALAGRGITAVLTTGWEHPVGREVHAWAMRADVPNAVLQDGTVTPFSAPLPPRTTLLAWTEADGEFRRSGRREIEVRAVGSQRSGGLARRPGRGRRPGGDAVPGRARRGRAPPATRGLRRALLLPLHRRSLPAGPRGRRPALARHALPPAPARDHRPGPAPRPERVPRPRRLDHVRRPPRGGGARAARVGALSPRPGLAPRVLGALRPAPPRRAGDRCAADRGGRARTADRTDPRGRRLVLELDGHPQHYDGARRPRSPSSWAARPTAHPGRSSGSEPTRSAQRPCPTAPAWTI